MKIKLINKSGLSFIEVIIAIFILATGMVAVLGLMAASLKESLDARNQRTAVFLAQEGVELVRNFRDNTWASGNLTFEGNIGFPNGNPNNNCVIDYIDTDGIVSSSGNDGDCGKTFDETRLYFDANDFFTYDNTSANPSKFNRKIEINYVGPDRNNAEKAIITSMVVWNRTSFPAIADCNTAHKCSYTEATLSRWGE